MTSTSQKLSCSIVIPVYNSTNTLVELAEAIDRVFQQTIQESYELIFVDDGSSNPSTWPTLLQITQAQATAFAIRLTRNFGQICATLCGLEAARGKYVIIMDDDLQHSPEDIPKLLAHRDHDVVLAKFGKKRHDLIKRLTSRIKGYFDWLLLRKPFHIEHSSFFLIRDTIVKGILSVQTSYPLLLPLIMHCTRDVVNAEVSHQPRREGRSGYSLRMRFRLFSNLLINNSSFLLSVIGYLGVGISFVTFVMFLFYFIRKLAFGIGVSGWTSLMVAVLVIGGILLFAVGIIGTYLIRIIHTSEHRPGYVVRYDTRKETD